MPDGLLNRAIAKIPLPTVLANWGMTELSSVATMTKLAILQSSIKRRASCCRIWLQRSWNRGQAAPSHGVIGARLW
jgi:hypothetical protein